MGSEMEDLVSGVAGRGVKAVGEWSPSLRARRVWRD